MNDKELSLWSSVRKGDEESFRILFDRYYAFLCILSNRYTHNMSLARDIVQDLFVRLWEKREETDIRTSLKAYLTQAVRFNSIRRLKDNHEIYLENVLVNESPGDSVFHDHLEYAEIQSAILEAIESMPVQCRKVFEKSRFECLTYKEISKEMEISVKTVEAHISKALRIIQSYLEKTAMLALLFIFNCHL